MTDEWRFPFPNAADFNFNYWKLLHDSEDGGIGSFDGRAPPRVAIVGAGAAGLVAARELLRSGVREVDIYEATNRIGGRLWSELAPGQKRTTFELGAMRIPRFTNDPAAKRSAFEYYADRFEIECQPFMNPGAVGVTTGIFLKDGYGPDGTGQQGMIRWTPTRPNDPPPDPLLREVWRKWTAFADRFKTSCEDAYNQGGAAWESMWKSIVSHYGHLDFADLVFLEPAAPRNGYFGGLGMSEAEARIFYVIGLGDGGWGAFFNVAALYPIRVMLFGFGTGHQLVVGRSTGFRVTKPLSENGKQIPSPQFLGVQSLAESLLFAPIGMEATGQSVNDRARLRLGERVTKLEKPTPSGPIRVNEGREYEAVILTCPTWALQLSIEFVGFDSNDLPFDVRHSLKTSHWITSCKVFWPLKKAIEQDASGGGIPPLLMTDRFIQGVYAYAVPPDPGVLLSSYTWEDDATKLLSIADDDELARRCIDELRDVLETCGIDDLDEYVDLDASHSRVIRWSREPTYAGCSKLYRERMWDENYALLRYNQDIARKSGLYFAGDAYSVESGWVESAIRSALDATIYLLKNRGARVPYLKH